jgi:hypothetical protein
MDFLLRLPVLDSSKAGFLLWLEHRLPKALLQKVKVRDHSLQLGGGGLKQC